MQRVVFKPYACGTMSHPYIDCTLRLAQQGIRPDDIVSVVCETGEGLVHRLWEPLAAQHQPPSGYAAKFSMPYCMAVGLYEGDAGLPQLSDDKARDPRILALARTLSHVIARSEENTS